jgi:hypothetical protein
MCSQGNTWFKAFVDLAYRAALSGSAPPPGFACAQARSRQPCHPKHKAFMQTLAPTWEHAHKMQAQQQGHTSRAAVAFISSSSSSPRTDSVVTFQRKGRSGRGGETRGTHPPARPWTCHGTQPCLALTPSIRLTDFTRGVPCCLSASAPHTQSPAHRFHPCLAIMPRRVWPLMDPVPPLLVRNEPRPLPTLVRTGLAASCRWATRGRCNVHIAGTDSARGHLLRCVYREHPCIVFNVLVAGGEYR